MVAVEEGALAKVDYDRWGLNQIFANLIGFAYVLNEVMVTVEYDVSSKCIGRSWPHYGKMYGEKWLAEVWGKSSCKSMGKIL